MSKFVRMLNNLRCTPDGEGAANLRGVRDADENENENFMYLVLGGDGSVPLKARTDPSATYTPSPRRLSIPSHHRATTVSKEDWRRWGSETPRLPHPPLPLARARAQ